MNSTTSSFEPTSGGDTAGEAPKSEQTLQPDTPPRPADAAPTRRPRGFAAMDRKLVSELARKGGKAAHSAGTAHEFTPDEAREAGRKGGQAAHARRKNAPSKPAEPGRS